MSISKGKNRNSGREVIYTKNKNVVLKPNDSLLYFIQRIRDEAHRFAITAHRSRRNKSSIESVFKDLHGIGPKKKKALLSHFGSLNNIKKASLEELKEVKELSDKIINEIYSFFNSQ